MDHVRVDLDPTVAPSEHIGALVASLPGAWRVEGAEHAWRAEQVRDGLVRSVGLARTPEGWVLSWRVDPDVPDGAALAVLGAAMLLSVAVLTVAVPSGHPLLGLVGSAVALLGTIRVGRALVRARLPPTDAAEAELAAALVAAGAPLSSRPPDRARGSRA